MIDIDRENDREGSFVDPRGPSRPSQDARGVRLVDPDSVDPAIKAWWFGRLAEAAGRRAAERAREAAGDGRGAWHLVQTVPRGEVLAAGALGEAGFGVFLPRYRASVPVGRLVPGRTRRVIAVERALFAGYLFVRVEPGQGCYGVGKARGVARIVATGEGPAVVPDVVVGALMAEADAAGLMAPPPDGPSGAVLWAVGEVVRMIGGPLAGFEGPVTAVDERGAVRVDLALFGRAVAVTASAEDVAKVTSSPRKRPRQKRR